MDWNKIDFNNVAKRYNSLDVIIDEDDTWHLITERYISAFITDSARDIGEIQNKKILNAGSAENSYHLPEKNILHVDIAEKHISHLSNSLVASIESLPIGDNEFDVIICVGSVLNYCDPIVVMQQFSRVLKHDGYLILEYENSRTFELIFKKNFNQSAVFIETFFDAHGDKECIWYFSEDYITQLLSSFDFKVINQKRFHLFSPLIYRIFGSASFAAKFSNWDVFFSKLPWFNKLSSNVICLSQIKKN